MDLSKTIRNIPDFPKKGILFRDITTLINNSKAFHQTIDNLARLVLESSNKIKAKPIDYVVAAEARGFILGGALAYKLKCGFVPVRKPSKLPAKTYRYTYNLEYGKDSLEIHRDALKSGSNIVIFDDLIATGGTILAMVHLVNKLKVNIVAIAFLIELTDLGGRKKLKNYPVCSLIKC